VGFGCNGRVRKLLQKTLDSRDHGPIIRGVLHSVPACTPVEEVIMTSKRNYFPCVDLKNLHIPLT
jgi:hypothetical protein